MNFDNIYEQVTKNIAEVDDQTYKDMLEAMDANLYLQEEPKVGIFWYSPRIKDIFGVIAVNAKDQAKIENNRSAVSCKELHKYVWKKKLNYYKYHHHDNEYKLFQGDYKDTPRGRVFYFPKTDEYVIMVGSWINDYPDVIPKIKEAFDLLDDTLNVKIEKAIHWEIGMGYGD